MKLKNVVEKKVPVMGWRDKVDNERVQQIKDFVLDGIEDKDTFDKDYVSFVNVAFVSLEDSKTQTGVSVYIRKRIDEIQVTNSPTYIETRKYSYTIGENERKIFKITGGAIDIINSETEARAYTLSLGYNSKFKEDMRNIIVTNDFTKDNIIKNLEEMIRANDKYETGAFESTGVMLMWDGFCHFSA